MNARFEPKTLDGLAAARRLRDTGKVTPGWCLQVTWQAFGSPRSDQKHDAYPWATDARKGAQEEGALTRGRLEDAPPGAVLYWSGVWGTWLRDGKRIWGDAGHVAIVTADRKIATIDLPKRGGTGAVTPAEFREAWRHLVFEGWAIGPGAFLGHTVIGEQPVTPESAKPAAPKPNFQGETMAKIIREEGKNGRVALITELGARVYGDTAGRDFSIGLNIELFGEHPKPLTRDQFDTAVREAENRGRDYLAAARS
ncbi:hypothetical protein D9V32_13430 [Mycetocola tolaasinivorans]|uniref:Uncharacterized protein n=1 Tax=Mycetocola tolaasinivorans TaxID=76635 RepID=A0A3L7A2P8_9MICO|nr:hypothetical protein [Mycetocola tolaasinivorans]RLP74344.1 hypothetical protein D9V32_13430 [Mycetocola tolaasinivorans]